MESKLFSIIEQCLDDALSLKCAVPEIHAQYQLCLLFFIFKGILLPLASLLAYEYHALPCRMCHALLFYYINRMLPNYIPI